MNESRNGIFDGKMNWTKFWEKNEKERFQNQLTKQKTEISVASLNPPCRNARIPYSSHFAR